MKKRIKLRPGKTLVDLMLIIMALISLIPFIYMFLTSLREVYSMVDYRIKLDELSFQNYVDVFTGYPYLKYFRNSTIAVVLACTLNVVVGAMAGYGFAKKKFKGRDKIFSAFLATMMIPGQVIMIPVYLIFNKVGLLNTFAALTLPSVGAFSVFMMRQFMCSLPDDLLEAAKIDGCGEARTFLQIVLPLVKPIVVSLTIFTFISIWNDFVWPLITVTDDSHTTLTLALSTLNGLYKTNYGLVMAGATLSFLPAFILYVFLQKQFVEGIVMSGIKG